VQVDDKRLRQVLLNLLSNAVKFTPRGQVCFRVCPLPGKKTDAGASIRLRFEVEDTGVGIPADRQQEIFLPFHQLNNAMTDAEGSGLGLTISANLVRLMDGRLEVESTPGKGSRFWFELNLPVVQQPTVEQTRGGGFDAVLTKPAAGAERLTALSRCLQLPDMHILDQMTDCARRHDVLGLRKIISELEQDPRLRGFIEHIAPLIHAYQFRKLIEDLQMLTQSGDIAFR